MCAKNQPTQANKQRKGTVFSKISWASLLAALNIYIYIIFKSDLQA